MHSRAVVTENWLWHKRDGFVMPFGDIAKDVFVILHESRHLLERCEADVDLGLSGSGHLMMLPFDGTPAFSSSKHISLRMSCSVSIGETGK